MVLRCIRPSGAFLWMGILATIIVVHDRCVAEDWPQWRGVQRDATINDPTLVRQLPPGQVPLRWSVPVGPGYSGPTVSGGRVFLTDRQGEAPEVSERVLCFDADSGDLLWQHSDPVEYSIGYRPLVLVQP